MDLIMCFSSASKDSPNQTPTRSVGLSVPLKSFAHTLQSLVVIGKVVKTGKGVNRGDRGRSWIQLIDRHTKKGWVMVERQLKMGAGRMLVVGMGEGVSMCVNMDELALLGEVKVNTTPASRHHNFTLLDSRSSSQTAAAAVHSNSTTPHSPESRIPLKNKEKSMGENRIA
ncbi:hypothetical protein Ddc_16531 [Ditylenchus destructor]|nr:hypothetical protein Ddc_16531 [Ditylenchus destructor]